MDLAPGDYYGQIRVTSATADSSPQIATVVLTVLPAGSEPPPVVRPTGLIFTMTADGPPPGSQSVQISNLSPRVTAFTSGRIPQDPDNWFVHQPTDSAVAPDQPVEIIDSQVKSDPKTGDLVQFSIKGAFVDPDAPAAAAAPAKPLAGRGAGAAQGSR